jgi:ABC-type dipeptide/oligopeptide/nickel transport system permease component
VIGIILFFTPFTPLNILQNWYCIISGVFIYFIGLVLGIIAFSKKESGLLKFISLFSVIFFFVCLIYFFSFMGQI